MVRRWQSPDYRTMLSMTASPMTRPYSDSPESKKAILWQRLDQIRQTPTMTAVPVRRAHTLDDAELADVDESGTAGLEALLQLLQLTEAKSDSLVQWRCGDRLKLFAGKTDALEIFDGR